MSNDKIIRVSSDEATLSGIQLRFNKKVASLNRLKAKYEHEKAISELIFTTGSTIFYEKEFAYINRKLDLDIELAYRVEQIKTTKMQDKYFELFLIENIYEYKDAFGDDNEKLNDFISSYKGGCLEDLLEEVDEEVDEMFDVFTSTFGKSIIQLTFEEKYGPGIKINLDSLTAELLQNPELAMKFIMEQNKDVIKEAEQKQNAKKEIEEQKKATKKKTKKQVAQEIEEKEISKTVREIYTSLVKEFHPDLEQDESEKQRKTVIMQRITEAYSQNNLFDLLQLQLEYEQVSYDDINALSEKKLKYYIKLIDQQIATLEKAFSDLFIHRIDFEQDYLIGKTLEKTEANLKKEGKRLDGLLRNVEEQLTRLGSDSFVSNTLKQIVREQKEKERFNSWAW